MTFVATIDESNQPYQGALIPIWAAVHSAGFDEVYQGSTLLARKSFVCAMTENVDLFTQERSPFEYILASIWGDIHTGDKVVDFFGYVGSGSEKGGEAWQRSNPESRTFVTRNGILVPLGKERVCEDTQILLADIARQRRKTTSLEAFFEEEKVILPNLLQR